MSYINMFIILYEVKCMKLTATSMHTEIKMQFLGVLVHAHISHMFFMMFKQQVELLQYKTSSFL